MKPSARDTLGVDKHAGRTEIITAYRKLAMKWHPDRNASPDAQIRFQEIQRAYRYLQARHAPGNVRAMWDELAGKTGGDFAMEAAGYNDGFWQNFPFLSAAVMAGGVLLLYFTDSPGNYLLFSLAVAVANSTYRPGGARIALRAEAAFRLLSSLYFIILLCSLVWFLAKQIAAG